MSNASSFMTLCLALAVAASCISAPLPKAQETAVQFVPSLSSTTVRGYIATSAQWQPHVCRPLLPIRTQRVLQLSSNGAVRDLGRNVPCRHGVVFVPGSANLHAASTPNRSSRFAATPEPRKWIIVGEIQVDRYGLPPGLVLPPAPHQRPGSSPVFVGGAINTALVSLVRETRRFPPNGLPPVPPPRLPPLPQ
jgi:hypothetical protein